MNRVSNASVAFGFDNFLFFAGLEDSDSESSWDSDSGVKAVNKGVKTLDNNRGGVVGFGEHAKREMNGVKRGAKGAGGCFAIDMSCKIRMPNKGKGSVFNDDCFPYPCLRYSKELTKDSSTE